MTYYPDLSPYRYELSFAVEDVLCIGWLDGEHAFAIGVSDDRVCKRLRDVALLGRANLCRGCHTCELCGVVADERGPLQLLGASEIWVPRAEGGYFACPDLVIHYIEQHHYSPPQAFVDALLLHDALAMAPDMERVANDVINRAYSAKQT